MCQYEYLSLKHAKAAMHSQSACNASALILSLADQMDAIWTEARDLGKGTEYVNGHPLVVMFTTQLAHLAGLGTVDADAYAKASNLCEARLERASQ